MLPTSDILYTVCGASLKEQSETTGGLSGIGEHVKEARRAGLVIEVGKAPQGVAKKYAFCKEKFNGGKPWNPPCSNAVTLSTAKGGPVADRRKRKRSE